MPTSAFDTLMANVAIPALEAVFGIAAVHTNSNDDELDLTVMLGNELMAVGEYGECMEFRTVIEVAKSAGIAIGDTLTIENDPTDSEPDPDPTIWKTTQLMADDGYLQKFAVIEVVEETDPEPDPTP